MRTRRGHTVGACAAARPPRARIERKAGWMIERPLLLEATRMVATSWTGRPPTGIDRVCHAYARHFGPRAQAVIQHRGVARILSPRDSDDLFALLSDRAGGFRRRFAAFAPRAWAAARSRVDGQGAFYLNVSH